MTTSRLTTDVERALDDPVRACEHRRPELEERHALARHVLAPLHEQLCGLRRQPHADATAVRRLDDRQHALLVQLLLREDQLVRALAREDLGQLVQLAEQAQARLAPVGDRSDELVVDVPAPAAERAVQRRERLSVTDENHAPAHAGDAQQLCRSRPVGGAKEPDRDGAQGRRRRDQARGRELVVGAEPECEHHERDQDERGDHRAEPGAPLARGIEPSLPEDEHRDRREEGKPRRRPFPEEAPEDVRAPVDELAQHERGVDPEREAGDVEGGERRDAEEPPAERPERRGEQRVGATRAHIRGRLDSIDLRRVAALLRELGRRGGLERHDRPL